VFAGAIVALCSVNSDVVVNLYTHTHTHTRTHISSLIHTHTLCRHCASVVVFISINSGRFSSVHTHTHTHTHSLPLTHSHDGQILCISSSVW